MLDHELSFLKKGLVLRLEHLKLLESIVTNFLELLFILSVNLGLDLLPVIVRKFLFIVKVLECLLHWNGHGSLIDRLFDWHLGDSWAHILDGLSNWLTCLDNLWSLFHEIWFNWIDILEVLLLHWHILFVLLLHWRRNRFDIFYWLLSVLWLKVLWRCGLHNDRLNWWCIELLRILSLNILHWLFNILNWLLLHELRLFLVVGGLLN